MNTNKRKAPSNGLATFKEWQELGMYISRGEKSTRRNEKGEPLFGFGQVRPNIRNFTPKNLPWICPDEQPH